MKNEAEAASKITNITFTEIKAGSLVTVNGYTLPWSVNRIYDDNFFNQLAELIRFNEKDELIKIIVNLTLLKLVCPICGKSTCQCPQANECPICGKLSCQCSSKEL